jgi:sterol 3beta-glucosyltransferase
LGIPSVKSPPNAKVRIIRKLIQHQECYAGEHPSIMHITILTVGSRGDVQPYLALGRGLKAAGHHVRFATERIYQDWVESEGLEYAFLTGDSKARHAQEAWLSFVYETRNSAIWSIYRCNREFVAPVLRSLLDSAWAACQGTEVIISMPSVFGGSHIAEKLGIPCFSMWTSAITPTSEFPHSWSRWRHQRWLGGALNQLSYLIAGALYGLTLVPTINQWRKDTLNLPPGGNSQPIPMLYVFSPSVVPPPPDWDENVHVTGYWFLDATTPFDPPDDLVNFIADGAPPLYLGFGSTADRHPEKTLQIAIDAVIASGHRAVLETGWAPIGDLDLPPQIFRLTEAVPHTWLFPQMAALVHHGGTGTIAQGLRYGKATAIFYQKFIDYYFWAQRVAELGVGTPPICLEDLTVERLANAIETVMSDRQMQQRAAQLGQKIRAEDGVARAIDIIHQHLNSAALPSKQLV